MSEYKIQDTTLTGIADAIRSKTGGAATILVSEMANKIESIPTGGGGDEERNKTVQTDFDFIDLENDSRVALTDSLVWTKSSTYKYDTEEGYTSPPIDNGGQTTQRLTFTPAKDGYLAVFYACTSEGQQYDFFRFVVNDSAKIEQYSQGNTQNYVWKALSLKCVANQTQTLVFSYKKDNSTTGGYDNAAFLISFWGD